MKIDRSYNREQSGTFFMVHGVLTDLMTDQHSPCNAEGSDEAASQQQRTDGNTSDEETFSAAGHPPVDYICHHIAHCTQLSHY